MKILIFYYFIFSYLLVNGQVTLKNKFDSLMVINGDTVFTSRLNSGLDFSMDGLYLIGGFINRGENKSSIRIYEVIPYKNSVGNGLSISYNEKYELISLNYKKCQPDKIYDSLYGEVYSTISDCINEGINVKGSLYENRIESFTVYNDKNLPTTTFIINKHSRIAKRIFYDSQGNPNRIIFFSKKMKIKGVYFIKDEDLKNDYLRHNYWKIRKR